MVLENSSVAHQQNSQFKAKKCFEYVMQEKQEAQVNKEADQETPEQQLEEQIALNRFLGVSDKKLARVLDERQKELSDE
jgi:hypothetical protein